MNDPKPCGPAGHAFAPGRRVKATRHPSLGSDHFERSQRAIANGASAVRKASVDRCNGEGQMPAKRPELLLPGFARQVAILPTAPAVVLPPIDLVRHALFQAGMTIGKHEIERVSVG